MIFHNNFNFFETQGSIFFNKTYTKNVQSGSPDIEEVLEF